MVRGAGHVSAWTLNLTDITMGDAAATLVTTHEVAITICKPSPVYAIAAASPDATKPQNTHLGKANRKRVGIAAAQRNRALLAAAACKRVRRRPAYGTRARPTAT